MTAAPRSSLPDPRVERSSEGWTHHCRAPNPRSNVQPSDGGVHQVERGWQRLRSDERGAGYVAAFIVLFSVLVFAVVGLLVDVSRYYTAYRQVDVMSMEAARAGANAIDALPLGAGQTVVDPGRAQAAASAAISSFVEGSNVSVDSINVSGGTVTVGLSQHVSPRFALFSGRTVSASSHATAMNARSGP